MFDEESFNRIYDKYAAGVRRYCLIRLSNDTTAAEEAASDVFVILYRKWDELDRGEGLGLWLIRCADRCIMQQKQKFGRYYGKIEPAAGDALDRMHDPTAAADGELAAKELTERIERALPEKYVKLFRWRYLEGIPITEVAGRLGRNYATVKSQYQKLDRLLYEIEKKIEKDGF